MTQMSQIFRILQSLCDDFYRMTQILSAALSRSNRGFSRCNRIEICVIQMPKRSLNLRHLCNLW